MKLSDILGFRDKLIIEIVESTGIKAGELVGLNQDDVTPESIIARGKTGTRILDISKHLYRKIWDYLFLTAPFRQGTKALFLNYRGQRITRRGVNLKLNRKNTSLRKLRYEYGKLMFEAGCTGPEIMDTLGIRSVMVYYTYKWKKEKGK